MHVRRTRPQIAINQPFFDRRFSRTLLQLAVSTAFLNFGNRRDASWRRLYLLARAPTAIFVRPVNSFAVMRNYIACTCVGAHLLGITRVGDTAYCVWLIVFTSDCCVGSSAPMVVHVLDCRRGFEHLTGCKWRHARYIRCRLQRCCLQRVIHALPISHGKGGLDSIT